MREMLGLLGAAPFLQASPMTLLAARSQSGLDRCRYASSSPEFSPARRASQVTVTLYGCDPLVIFGEQSSSSHLDLADVFQAYIPLGTR